jgi:hypothetical protein
MSSFRIISLSGWFAKGMDRIDGRKLNAAKRAERS